MRQIRLLILLPLLGTGGPVAADTTPATTPAKTLAKDSKYLPKDPDKASKKRDIGWTGGLDVGATMSLAQSSNVIGSTDGYAWGLGAQIKGSLDYIWRQHEWRNTLKLGEAFTRTSQIDEFVKSTDELALKSTYLYLFKRVPWLGPFAELRLDTSIFEGHDVRSSDTTYAVKALDGSTRSETGRRIRLSDPFAPLTLREAVGALGRPVDTDPLKVELKATISARQTFADNQLAIDDDSKTTDIIEVKELESFYQGGPALGVGLSGILSKGKVSYYALFEAMFPVVNSQSEDDKRSVVELTNIAIEAGLTFKLVDWASLVYQFKAVREPQLLDKFQIQNNLLLSFSYTLIKDKQAASK